MILKRMMPFMILVLLLAMVIPVNAQDGDGLSEQELALLAEVQASVLKFYEQQTYAVAGQQVSTTGIDMMGQKMEFTSTQNIAGQTILGKDGEVAASYQSLEQVTNTGIPGMSTDQTFAYETILVDDMTYIRFTTSMPGIGMTSDMFPDEWTLVTEDGEDSMLSLYTLYPSFGSSYLPINGFSNPALIDSVVEIEGEEIDGQAMRLIELQLNVAEAQTAGFYGTNQVATSSALGAVMGGGAPSNPGVPSTDAVTQEQLDQFLEGMTMVQRVWLGVDDQLPYRVEIIITIDTEMAMAELGGMSLPLSVETTTTLDFGDFNAVFDITAPEIAE